MDRTRKAAVLLSAAAFACVLPAAAERPVEIGPKPAVPAKLLPYRDYEALPGKAVGVLVGDPQPVLTTEGRSGPDSQLCFSRDGCSYRWVYVPTQDNPMIRNLQVPVGEQAGQVQVYPALNLASPEGVAPFGVREKFTLVEAVVNDGRGSPANDSFVATSLKVLDGTDEYPLRVADAVAKARKEYAKCCAEEGQRVDAALAEAERKVLQGEEAGRTREKSDLMYVTWRTANDTLEVRFRTTVQSVHYLEVEEPRPRPLPLPPPPAARKQPQPPPPPPPARFKLRGGDAFGVQFGCVYVFNKQGRLVNTVVRPIESFAEPKNPPPAVP